MDPNETLTEIRKLTTKRNNNPPTFDSVDAAILCELFDALDAWITRGGFLPNEWSN